MSHSAAHLGKAQNQKCLEVLEFFRSIVAPPTLAELVTHLITENRAIIGIVTVVALGVALALRLSSKLRPSRESLATDRRQLFSTTLPWISTAVLVSLLIFIVSPIRLRQREDLLAQSWLDWQKKVESSAGQCGKYVRCLNDNKCKSDKHRLKESLVKESSCLSDKVTPLLQERPRLKHETDVTGLAGDLLAGQVMLANSNTRAVLAARLSTGGRFIGAGLAEPADEEKITAARVPEFFVANIDDKSNYVSVWELNRADMVGQHSILDTRLLDVLRNSPTLNKTDMGRWNYITQHLNSSDPLQPLVRFGVLSHEQYSGCLGRQEATHVFMIALADVADKTLQEAARSSGYMIPPKGESPELKLFVWIYAPTLPGQAVPATWATVLEHFGAWVKDEGCKKEG